MRLFCLMKKQQLAPAKETSYNTRYSQFLFQNFSGIIDACLIALCCIDQYSIVSYQDQDILPWETELNVSHTC